MKPAKLNRTPEPIMRGLIMNPNEGRLQTAEHILARTIEKRFADARFVISKFEETSGLMEIISKEDLRKINLSELQGEVNSVIRKGLKVNKFTMQRSEAEKEFDLARLPSSVTKIRIVEIVEFHRTPCKDPHVENTGEVGLFQVPKVERVGKDRYRFVFEVEWARSMDSSGLKKKENKQHLSSKENM